MADNNANEYSTVTLSLDDGTECECAIVRIFPAGDNNYIALLPLEGEAASNDEVYLYRYTEKDNGEPVLENIESDEEYETANSLTIVIFILNDIDFVSYITGIQKFYDNYFE